MAGTLFIICHILLVVRYNLAFLNSKSPSKLTQNWQKYHNNADIYNSNNKDCSSTGITVNKVYTIINNRKSNDDVSNNYEVSTERTRMLQRVKPIISLALASLTAGLITDSSLSKANAKVFFDTDVYGDKELKIATVNKIKQKLRNAILQDISVAPDLLKLAINDALGYDYSTTSGGPDGSIVFEMDRSENKGLEKALAVVLQVKKDLQRTNTVSLADIVAFGGAEALETVGCGRVTGIFQVLWYFYRTHSTSNTNLML